MSDVTLNDFRKMLTGLEVGGSLEKAYKVSYAVPDDILGKERKNNSSGFSYGVAQLDIGNNLRAQWAIAKLCAMP